MPRKKQKPEIAEHVPEIAAEYEPALFPGPNDKKGKEYSALTTKLAEQRLIRLKHQNSKLKIELRKLRGQVGDIEKMKSEILAANAIVKQQLLAIPFRLTVQLAAISDPREIHSILERALIECLNDLAFEREANANAA